MMKKLVYITCLVLFFLTSCQKDFLDKKPNKSLTNPSTLADYWALLDNRDPVMQFTPGMGELASDDLYFTSATWTSLNAIERNSYTWAADIYEGGSGPDWQKGYQRVYYANCVLEGIENISKNNANNSEWNNLRGSALFLRAYAFYNLAEIFAKPYSSSASSDLGIPLRLSSDLSTASVRANLQQTYDQIIGDLIEAKSLVPPSLSENRSRPSKPSVTALLSRIFLSMGNFQLAEQYADSTLNNHNQLLDYNTVDQSSTSPFNRTDHPEVLYESNLSNSTSLLGRSNTLVDSVLLAAYDKDDLRKPIFFRTNPAGKYYFKGRYTTKILLFSGLATDEIYLNRAECLARRGQAGPALLDLNKLLENRWRKVGGTSVFTPYSNLEPETTLNLVLTERRKELVFRGIRWMDLRRLNREPAHQITMRRVLNGTEYLLEPGSNRYIFPIPPDEIALSGIQQNER